MAIYETVDDAMVALRSLSDEGTVYVPERLVWTMAAALRRDGMRFTQLAPSTEAGKSVVGFVCKSRSSDPTPA